MKNVFKTTITFLVCIFLTTTSQAQKLSADDLFLKMRTKLLLVKDYTADIKMKVDVSFMKVPVIQGKLYFKAPGKMKLERNGGISIMPKKSISLSLNGLVPEGNVTVIDAGMDTSKGKKWRILKVIPEGESTIILSKIWIDEEKMLAMRTETTTRDNGTIKMELSYGKFIKLSLPDQVIFYMDVKELKLPKGVTMDYDDGEPVVDKAKKAKNSKGRIQITYLSYKVNTGLSDKIFEENTN